MPIWYAPVVVPKRANTYLAGSRTYPSTLPTGDTRCRYRSVHQSHRVQSQGPPSCPTSQLMYWQPKGLPVPPITPAPCLGRMPTSTTPLQDVLFGNAGASDPSGVCIEVSEVVYHCREAGALESPLALLEGK